MPVALLITLALLLAGCASGPKAPIEDRQTRAASALPAANAYLVKRGDTLYSIAFRFGLDYRDMAAANGIGAPYTIYPGQRLTLIGGRAAGYSASPQPVARATPAPRARASAPPPATVVRPEPSQAPVVTPPSSTAARTVLPAAPVPATPAPKPPLAAVSAWRWPASGPVSRGYSATVHKGIDISGKRGEAVVAAAAGEVVYAGTGIVGFGELLIIKHDDVYLSAYGHNDRLLVAEGERVSAGQQIAEKGSSGTDTVKLHFEIRQEGRPADPLGLLPRR
ncbi:peptidoglycan DD-metalloendopeptidase family protein [Haliea sp. E1-2-M8]|uniref:peptidoglycan DD-metalloendopeptidase family protein n=1 Tax=Haliea sp. E1-2-M8 TaxID=3064706 RepID=UPI00271A2CA3|nr:peptidoglycan DD-metalloendopeptidase family protein [Haliea sp. E1-2-M8]MDO8861245.1 peptidoglycan DD-metalloendopeptidase family protein [Haliea sp. E1-2-M8]